MSDCVFCQMIRAQIPTSRIYEDDQVLVFKDIHPKAPVHLLIISKEHIPSLVEVRDDQQALLGHMLGLMPTLAAAQGLKGFKTQINTGPEGGQEIDHLHFHLLGG